MQRSRNGRRLRILRTAVAGLAAWAAVLPAHPRAADAPGTPLPELVLIKPGTRVGTTPPSGWSDLVIKSLPKVESGDLDSLPTIGLSTASLFRTVMLADVRPAGGGHQGHVLERVGLGICVPVDGADTVVTEENAGAPPVSLGFLQCQVLAKVVDELKRGRLVGRTPTFAVFASPTDLKVGKAHKKIFLNYALVVDPTTGRLDTLVWAVLADPEGRTPPGTITRMAPALVEECGLDVLAERLLGALPINWSFAMRSLPPGRRFATPPRLRPWLTDLSRIASKPDEFEALLRAETAQPLKTPPPSSPTR